MVVACLLAFYVPAPAPAGAASTIITPYNSHTEAVFKDFYGPAASTVEITVSFTVSMSGVDESGSRCVEAKIRDGDVAGAILWTKQAYMNGGSTGGDTVTLDTWPGFATVTSSTGHLLLTTQACGVSGADIYSATLDPWSTTSSGWSGTYTPPPDGGGEEGGGFNFNGVISAVNAVWDAVTGLPDAIGAKILGLFWDATIPADLNAFLVTLQQNPPVSWFVEILDFIGSAVPTIQTGSGNCVALPGGSSACPAQMIGDIPLLPEFIVIAVYGFSGVMYLYLIRSTWQSVRH
jgi:hypothetical protein